uniref:Uncharacterized protein n=1 Tax=Globodera rostochiensis TaxID=31243 RepID=A0A914GX28_GLORO
MDRLLFRTLSLLVTTHSYAYSQLLPSAINLGSVSLQRTPFTGDLRLGVGQGANIFGFGGERQIGLNFGPGRFGTQIDNGLFLGGQRFGVDSHLGYQQGRGIDLGSILNLFQPIEQVVRSERLRSAHYPTFSPSRLPTQRQYPVPEHGFVPETNHGHEELLSRGFIPTENSEENFPSSVGSGWKDEEDKEKSGNPGTGISGAENVGIARREEQWNVGGTEKGGTDGKRQNKLPILTGLEPLKR